MTIQGLATGSYDIYVLLLDVSNVKGMRGVEFGIEYNDTEGVGIDIDDAKTKSCGDIMIQTATWPQSGSGVRITWTNCQNTAASGDDNNGVTKLVMVLRVTVHSDDTFSIIPFPGTSPPAAHITDCGSAQVNLDIPHALGRAVFGTQSLAPYDPCKGPFVPLSEFQSLTSTELAGLQLKIQSVSKKENRGPGPLILQGSSAVEDIQLFFAQQRPNVFYRSSSQQTRVTVSTTELSDAIDSLATIPVVATSDVEDSDGISVALLNSATVPPKIFEALVSRPTARDVFWKIRGAMLENPEALREIDAQVCARNLMTNVVPEDVTSSVGITFGPTRCEDFSSSLFHTTITLKNLSQAQLEAPLLLVLNPVPGVFIMTPEPKGYLCRNPGSGTLFFDVGDPDGLLPGESAIIDLKFRNPRNSKLNFEPSVLSGEGIP